jgi:hypothetical protein
MRNLDDQIATECRGNGGNCSIAQEQSPGAHLFGRVQSRQNRRCKHVDRLGDSGTAGDGQHTLGKMAFAQLLAETGCSCEQYELLAHHAAQRV